MPAVLAPGRVLASMEKVADWQLAHPTTYPLDDWTEGVGDTGLMALAGVSGSGKYREAMRAARPAHDRAAARPVRRHAGKPAPRLAELEIP